MEGLNIPADKSPKAPFLGISFRREAADHDGHVGLAWRDKNGGITLLHQRWHLALALDAAPHQLDATVQLPLPKANVAAIIRYALFFHKCVGKDLPYAFRLPKAVFDQKAGKLILRRGEGLTCTTAVIAILEGAGVVLLKQEEWPARADDEVVHAALVLKMQESYIKRDGKLTPDAQEHIAYLNVQKKAIRFRPAEVAAAASLKPFPVAFADAEVASAVLWKAYNEHYYPAPVEALDASTPADPAAGTSPATASPPPTDGPPGTSVPPKEGSVEPDAG